MLLINEKASCESRFKHIAYDEKIDIYNWINKIKNNVNMLILFFSGTKIVINEPQSMQINISFILKVEQFFTYVNCILWI